MCVCVCVCVCRVNPVFKTPWNGVLNTDQVGVSHKPTAAPACAQAEPAHRQRLGVRVNPEPTHALREHSLRKGNGSASNGQKGSTLTLKNASTAYERERFRVKRVKRVNPNP